MIQILLNQNYEVEITYHLKEMVVYEGEVLEIVNIPNIGRLDLENDRKAFVGIPVDEVRHATKEEIWWASNGRDVWEIRDNDVLSINDELFEVSRVGNANIIFNEPIIEWMSWEDFNNLKHNIRVVCFSHDRKDVDNE